MKEGGEGGFVRADQIDLKSLDEQLERHLSRAWTMDKNKKEAEDVDNVLGGPVEGAEAAGDGRGSGGRNEIDTYQLVIKGVIARHFSAPFIEGLRRTGCCREIMTTEKKASEAEIAQLRSAFIQEVSVWYKLDHPNVTKFIGAAMGARDLNVQTETGQLGIPSVDVYSFGNLFWKIYYDMPYPGLSSEITSAVVRQRRRVADLRGGIRWRKEGRWVRYGITFCQTTTMRPPIVVVDSIMMNFEN
ncbi:hypothetical protein HPP92_003805 [Vanilla planifolia]|uniref:Serine-threonine/tyrosine-protein kinase catalytic domain-containing protein n=1 Tax=Vanilla planifolia TaxID=51239 RepID=A0A835RVT1_VANPL|nr:hypothetical protein HPP92_003805 [Vanilla planifolia]